MTVEYIAGFKTCDDYKALRPALLIDATNKILFRNHFEDALQRVIKLYVETLPLDQELQANFIRKFNDLCP